MSVILLYLWAFLAWIFSCFLYPLSPFLQEPTPRFIVVLQAIVAFGFAEILRRMDRAQK